jgi:PPOX class probable F420-dependent enzyme
MRQVTCLADGVTVMSPVFDEQQPAHQKALGKLANDLILWFGSVRADGRPHSVPVWFLGHDGQALIFSEAKTQKIRNVRRDQRVVLSLETEGTGADVVILDGNAELSSENASAWLPRIGEAYTRKYAEGLKGIGLTVDQMALQYDQVIVVTPTRLTAW